MPQSNFWGRLIAKLREEQRVSQRKLASRANVHRATLRRIEEGATSGDMETMERLLNYLGYELEALQRSTPAERLRLQSRLEDNASRRAVLEAKRLLVMDFGLLSRR
jgi:transcriptional regulator with XRE-family HTH domain